MAYNATKTRLVVFSDTHVRRFDQLHPVIKDALGEGDEVAHCGDFTGLAFYQELRNRFPTLRAVYGNSDPDSIRTLVPRKQRFTLANWRIGMMHPWWGAEPDGIEHKLMEELERPDILLYGHTHERVHRYEDNTLIVNPGPGYAEFMTPGSVAVLELGRDSVEVEFMVFERPNY